MAHYHRGWSHGWRKSVRGDSGEWFDSGWELQYMDELDRDPLVARWTRHHGTRIPYTKWWGRQGFYEPDFLVELVGGSRELREVKGEHLLADANTTRKLCAGERYCRNRGMVFRVITKSAVDPGTWGLLDTIHVDEAPPSSRPPFAEAAHARGSDGRARYLPWVIAMTLLLCALVWFLLLHR
jgi:hypothetical protein